MAMFPKIQSPCPYKGDLGAIMDGDFCRMCKRNVVDLNGWSDGERVAFLKGCETEVCVTYRLPLRSALAAAALAAATMPLAAAAQEAPVAVEQATVADYEDTEIFMGGIKDPKNVEFVEDSADATIPDLPVIYEQAEPAKAASAPAKP